VTHPDPAQIFDLWEALPSLHPVDQALSMLAAAMPETSFEDLAELSIGARDRRLFELYAALFGPSLHGFEYCPACHLPVEYSLTVDSVFAMAESAGEAPGSLSRDVIRLPNSHDLAAIASCESVDSAREILVLRCCHGVERATGADTLDLSQALAGAIVAADPFADLTIELSCPACQGTWQRTLDPLPFLEQGLFRLAREQLYEVHTLALSYGWSESAILSMPTERRRLYVRMLEG